LATSPEARFAVRRCRADSDPISAGDGVGVGANPGDGAEAAQVRASGLLRLALVSLMLQSLCNRAQVVAWEVLRRRLASDEGCQSPEEEAADLANHLFARPGCSESDFIRQEAIRSLEDDPGLAELVVQSLRVLNTVEFASTGRAPEPVLGGAILLCLGSRFPEESNPESFQELIAVREKELGNGE